MTQCSYIFIGIPENNSVCSLMYIWASSKMLTCFEGNKKPMVEHSHGAILEEENTMYKWVGLQMVAETAHLQG